MGADTVRTQKALAGILVVTHGELGRSLLSVAELIMGPLEACRSICVDVQQSVDASVEAIRAAVEAVDAGAGVLVLTDLFGGTPTTLSLSLLKSKASIEVVTGANLPMLVEAVQGRRLPLPELAAKARDAGQQGIVVPGEILKRKKNARHDKGEKGGERG
jgi:PTS system mannose-specific IIA component